MSKICKITGKKPNVANNVSHANNKTKRRQFANLQNKKIFVPELGKYITTKLSTKAIKTIDKYGFSVRRFGLLGPYHWSHNIGIEKDIRYKVLPSLLNLKRRI